MTINTQLPNNAIEQLQQIASENEVDPVVPVTETDTDVNARQGEENAASVAQRSATEVALEERLNTLREQRQQQEQAREALLQRSANRGNATELNEQPSDRQAASADQGNAQQQTSRLQSNDDAQTTGSQIPAQQQQSEPTEQRIDDQIAQSEARQQQRDNQIEQRQQQRQQQVEEQIEQREARQQRNFEQSVQAQQQRQQRVQEQVEQREARQQENTEQSIQAQQQRDERVREDIQQREQRQREVAEQGLQRREEQQREIEQRIDQRAERTQELNEQERLRQLDEQQNNAGLDNTDVTENNQQAETIQAEGDALQQQSPQVLSERLQLLAQEIDDAEQTQSTQDIINTLREEAEVIQNLLRQQLVEQNFPDAALDAELNTIQQNLQEEVERNARRLQNNQPATARLGNFIDQVS